ncbi:protein of unknown function (DUF3328) domain containing protein [Rhypophila sp. PSN 637]
MYQCVPSSEDSITGDDSSGKERFQARSATFCRVLLFSLLGLVALLSSGIIGFFCGVRFSQGRHQEQLDSDLNQNLEWFAPPNQVQVTYEYQKHFSVRPDNQTEDPWMSLMPSSSFITYPSLSPDEAHGVAVFHQLHCLNGIREAYWAAKDGLPHSHVARPSHVRHCIDYLRQALMCHADTNLEPIIPELGGASGFGSEHKCRGFWRVKEFVGEWAVVEKGPPIANKSQQNPER